jgi:hypothetical protein
MGGFTLPGNGNRGHGVIPHESNEDELKLTRDWLARKKRCELPRALEPKRRSPMP